MAIDRSAYLGGPKDVQPVFRSEAADTSAWPVDALFAITWDQDRFHHVAFGTLCSPTEYFGADGWPLDLPASRKQKMPEKCKLEMQAEPQGWRMWGAEQWLDFCFVANMLRTAREQEQRFCHD